MAFETRANVNRWQQSTPLQARQECPHPRELEHKAGVCLLQPVHAHIDRHQQLGDAAAGAKEAPAPVLPPGYFYIQ